MPGNTRPLSDIRDGDLLIGFELEKFFKSILERCLGSLCPGIVR